MEDEGKVAQEERVRQKVKKKIKSRKECKYRIIKGW